MTQILIAYSSRTGNTKKVAEALYGAAEDKCVLMETEKVENLDCYDLIFVGYWVDKGGPDKISREFLQKLEGKRIVLFQTLGADPMSDHALGCFANAGKWLKESNSVLGGLSIRGAIDPKLIETMEKRPVGHPHAPTVESRKRWAEASTHPDQADLEKAAACMKRYVAFYEKYYAGK